MEHHAGRAWIVVLTLPVTAQIDLALKRLFAEATTERFVARMLSHVRYQVRTLREGFGADNAFVGLLACGNKIKARVKINYGKSGAMAKCQLNKSTTISTVIKI
jgi:hypothetical protein